MKEQILILNKQIDFLNDQRNYFADDNARPEAELFVLTYQFDMAIEAIKKSIKIIENISKFYY